MILRKLAMVLFAPLHDTFARAWWVLLKELHSFMGSNSAPLSIGIIAFVTGMVAVLPHRMDGSGENIINASFHLFYVIVLASAIFLSMSAFVSERRQGTLELLYTLPVTDFQLVMGKFLMGLILLSGIVCAMTLVYIFWIAQAPYYVALTGGVGLLLAGLYAYSVGIFASSVSSHYLVSLLVGTLLLCIIDIGGYMAGLLPSPLKEIISHMHGLNQFFAFTRGVLPLRGFVFFSSLTVLFLFLAVKTLESRRWRGVGGN